MALEKRICDICGREFMPIKGMQKRCSRECMEAGMARVKSKDRKKWYRDNHPLQEVQCLYCGRKFMPYRKGIKYCSDTCSINAKIERDRLNRKKINIVVKCVVCGKEFESMRGTAKYCSSKCQHKAAHDRWHKRLKSMSSEEISIRKKRISILAQRKKEEFYRKDKQRLEESMMGVSKETMDALWEGILP